MVERATLGVVVEGICSASNDHFTFVRLAHVSVHSVGHDDHIHAGFDRFRHQSLKRHGFNWKAEASHLREARGVTSHNDTELVAINRAFGCIDTDDFVPITAHTCHFALLDHIHAHVRAGTRIAPSHRIVTRCAAAGLP